MKQAIQSYHTLLQSITSNTKDFSVLSQLQSHLSTIIPSNEDPQVYIRLMFSIYDTSNHPNLLQASSQPHLLSIHLKLLACQMICIIIEEFMNGGGGYQLEREVEMEAFQILVVSVGVALGRDVGVGDVGRIWGYVKILAARCAHLDNKIHMLYILCYLDILRLTVTTPNFSLPQLLHILHSTLSLSLSLPSPLSHKFHTRIKAITSQITLKLLRQGNKQCLHLLSQYLPQQFINNIKKIEQGNFNIENVGDVGQLYYELVMHGMQGVSMEMLEGVVGRVGVYEGREFFQMVVIVGEPVLLELWFSQTNRRTHKPANYPQSFTCLIQLLISYLSPSSSPSSPSSPSSSPSPTDTNSLCRVCKQAILCLIREQKDSNISIQLVCTYILKFVSYIISNAQMYQICVDIFGNLELVSTKHSLPQIQKSISILQLYYSLVHHQKNIQFYHKFIKLNATIFSTDKDKQRQKQRNQALRLLKACAELQFGIKEVGESVMEAIKKKPQFALIFCQNKERTLLVLQLGYQEICKLGDVFLLYLALFQQNCWDDLTTQKIAYHLQKLLLTSQFSKLPTQKSSIHKLKNNLLKQIHKQNPIYCQLLLYMACFCTNFDSIRAQNYGVVLNKYSKLLKIIDLVDMSNQICSIIKILVCKSNQKFKKQVLDTHGKCSPEAGQLVFLGMLTKKLSSHLSTNPCTSHDPSLTFTKFNLFQLYCLTNRNTELQQILDQQTNPQLQQLYISSQFIPRQYKLSILRKLFRNNIINLQVDKDREECVLSLGEFKELIMLAESQEQCAIYVSQVVRMYGEKGRKFIMLLAEQNDKVQRVCLQVLK